ncbi:hypothetical protein RB2654_14530 [Rhodobacterales bacterium HTCC2654]|uniref:Uncharacterized protein n=1 Tax=Maritimibacter alkaliphilus HTCC2654 TaxID=314271 RepID=A3VGV5_9RHOB|nr:hypothetical protein RB2654_14530 [Rhodobacterales bacterium HTCC2654] [Maritimibacter alkaliphilus HTCC2654]
MQHQMIENDTGRHRLAHGHGTDADTGVVTALGDDFGRLARFRDRLARGQDRRCRLDREPADDVLPGRNTTKNAARVVRREHRLAVVPHVDFVRIGLARQAGRVHAFTDLDALHGVDRHHRSGQIGVELGIDRRPKARGRTAHDHLDHRADGRARLAQPVEVVGPCRGSLGVRHPERIALDLVPVETAAVDLVLAHAGHVAAHLDSRHQHLERLTRDTARRDAGRRFARR